VLSHKHTLAKATLASQKKRKGRVGMLFFIEFKRESYHPSRTKKVMNDQQEQKKCCRPVTTSEKKKKCPSTRLKVSKSEHECKINQNYTQV
jgi:hypothetical protein